MMDQQTLVTLTADIVAAHVANNNVAMNEVPELVRKIHEALVKLGQPEAPPPEEKRPVVSARASIRPDYLVCMECGIKQKLLRRHLRTAHKLTPEDYRRDYGLPPSYPMVAPNYSDRRRTLAHASGLGRRDPPASARPKRRTRKPSSEH
jgi:predicted transcriptional regulator